VLFKNIYEKLPKKFGYLKYFSYLCSVKEKEL